MLYGNAINNEAIVKGGTIVGSVYGGDVVEQGDATGTLQDKDIVVPSMKGNTGFMELGVKLFDASKYDIDIGGFGSVGKKKGVGFNLNSNWKF